METPEMVNESDGAQSEKIPDAFICCVCLDLLHKPIVLACGHVSCFWCIHKSMSGLRESHCPTCRHPYYHFPTICQMLHFLLMKMYPITYKRRESHILEEEREMGCFSPHLGGSVPVSCKDGELNLLHYVGQSSEDNPSSDTWGPDKNMKEKDFISTFKDTVRDDGKQNSIGSFEGDVDVAIEEQLCQTTSNGTCEMVSIADLLCAACKTLLFRPVVLNCGHVFCEGCIISQVNEILKCKVCQNLHPKGFPKVFLELDHFIEEQFPEEYALRRATIQLKQAQNQHENSIACDSSRGSSHHSLPTENNLEPWWTDNGSKVHIGVGCDFCGMYPIIGERYKCRDCVEAMGFDLCGDCYNTQSKLPGRFNQQHTPEHRFEIVRSNSIRKIMMRLLRGQMEEVLLPSDLFENLIRDTEDVFASLSHEAAENAENSMDAQDNDNDAVEDQSDNQTPHPSENP